MSNVSQRIAFNHATFGPDVPFKVFLETVAKSGVKGVGIWTDRVDGLSPQAAGQLVRSFGLKISGVNRGGFFTGSTQKERRDAIDLTRHRIDQTAELQADTLIIVPGGLSNEVRNIEAARKMVKDGLAEVAEYARTRNIRLAIEPFHPALSAARSVVNSLDLALDLCDEAGEGVGVVTDIFHIWWDPSVYRAIERAGSRIFCHHLCDWKLDTVDPFADRGVMGDGVADVPRLTASVMKAGYKGWMEIEIFSRNDLWKMEVEAICSRCLERALGSLQEAEQLCAGNC